VSVSYPFVRAHFDYGRRTRPVLAFVVHMAEGGGTVGYLARANPNGVSVHWVVERTGRVVQMLREDRISGSIRPTAIRRTDDAPFVDPSGDVVQYGATAAKAALERYWSDPNSVVLSCEVEGFASAGPNPAQVDALERLVADVRSRYRRIALLGHRDFASYKRCPGQLIPWGRLGGHYPAPRPAVITEGDPMIVGGGLTRTSSHVIDLDAGQPIHQTPGGPELVRLSRASTVEYFGIANGWYAVEVNTAATFDDGLMRPVIAYVPRSAGTVRAK